MPNYPRMMVGIQLDRTSSRTGYSATEQQIMEVVVLFCTCKDNKAEVRIVRIVGKEVLPFDSLHTAQMAIWMT